MGEIAEQQIERMIDGKSSCGPAHSKRSDPNPKEDFAPVKRIVQVVFAGNYERKYDFFTDLDLQLGDFVVCDTFRGYSVAKVVSILALTTNTKADKWIVQVVDVVGHAERMRGRELADLLG